MQYEIFLEVVYVHYSVIAFCVLFNAAAIRGIQLKLLRAVIASLCAGGVGCVGLVACSLIHPFCAVISFLIAVLLLSAIAFPIVSIRNYRKNCLAVLVSMVLVGGVSIVLENRLHILKNVIFCAGVLLVVACLFAYGIRRIKTKRSLYYPVTLYFDGEVNSVMALADSGNRIKDAQGRAVCVLSQGLVPADFSIENVYAVRLLGTKEQQLKGGIVSKMVVHTREGNLEYESVPVAVFPGVVSATGKFEMILESNYCMRE